jgi:CubicO group peptidase (beta-lactamase class C family)
MRKESGAVGFSVAVVKNSKLTYSNAFGFRDLENQVPLRSDHVFRIASISKSFSATSVMRLVEQGKLNLDADVSPYLGFDVKNPSYPDQKITLRLLLSHLSSINDGQGYFSLDVIDPGKGEGWKSSYSNYAPGDQFLYCNLNYNMVGTIIERASGMRFDRYVIENVLSPLKLYGGYHVATLDTSRFAYIYEYQSAGSRYLRSAGAYAVRPEIETNYTMGRSTPIFSPTGGMKISAPDLARYMTMHMNMGKYKGKRIISSSSARMMQTPVGPKEPYGFALETSTTMIPGETLIGHTGSAYGLFSAMFFEPKKKFGIVVISNGCPPEYAEGYNAFVRRVVNAVYQRLIKSE